MKIQNIIVSMGMNSVLGYGMGYLYGGVFNADKKLAAKAFMIQSLTMTILGYSAYFATGGSKTPLVDPTDEMKDENLANPKVFKLIHQAGITAIAIVSTIAFRHLNLIATLGTAISTIGIIGHLIILSGTVADYRRAG